ncbi:thiamine biosynthesis lipoprotein [Sinorhizobium fredii]|uniref:FAD:protein FMN transferase n=1 Tax=Sinorhizobium fredii (strain USDA 257) TaxID=1185652 RepID=I3X990_SINF2|nr:FAD:protein FMN transferase [Sinorhizobium fredii]AFL52446.1 NosX accesory protein NosX [Sinorhizobium fredii USDA 257]
MGSAISRRRAICIMAAAAGLPLLGHGGRAEAATTAITWNGRALGAPATLILNLDDKAKAARLIERVVAEVSRLERIFSLYRPDSALSELNRTGAIAAPPADLVSLLGASRDAWEATDGAFDPTVQPLWILYAQHFSAADANPAGPSEDEKRRALSGVGFDKLRFDRDRVVFARPGMALTLNGVAQGYITDRIVDLLKDAGVANSLVSMGEARAIGSREDGGPWRIGLAASEDAGAPDSILNLVNRAVATSSPDGFHFGDSARFGHILDPLSGEAPRLYRRVSVVAPTAAAGDAFSTAFSLMKGAAIRGVCERHSDLGVDLVSTSGAHARFGRIG